MSLQKWSPLVIASVLFLSGCKPKVIYVPVPCPEPPMIQRPALPISGLKPDDSIERERTLWVATVEVMDGYAKQLEKLLDGYRKGSK